MATVEGTQVRDVGDVSYDGFISYSHAADGLLAPRLQSGLQRFAKPWWKRRAVRIFRDESSLSANPHLWSSITEALDTSGWFVLLLSPDAARSEWVNQEIAYWVANRDPKKIVPVVTDGEFGWAGGEVTGDAVPDALRSVFSEEPRWVDVRWAKGEDQLDLQDPRFADAVADIASTIRGIPKDDLASEEVRHHRRTVRTAWAAGIITAVLALAAVGFGIQSSRNAYEAERQAAIAEQNAAAEAAARGEADANAALADANARAAEENALQAEQAALIAHGNALLSAARVFASEDVELGLLLAIEAASALGERQGVEEVIHGLLMAGTGHEVLDVTPDALTASYAVDVSPDGSLIAATAAGNEVTLFDAASIEAVKTFGSADERNSTSIPGIDFSSDGSLLAAVGTDGVARIWDVESGALEWEMDTGEGDTGFAEFADDDRLLITSIHLRSAWEIESRERVWVNEDQVQSFGGAPIDIDRSGRVVAWANKIAGEVVAVDATTGDFLWSISQPTPTFVAFHPFLDVVLTKPQEFRVEMYSYADGSPVQLHSLVANGPSAVAFAPDGSRFVVASEHESLVFTASEPDDPSERWDHTATLESGAALPLAMSFVSSDRVAIGQPGRAAVWSIEPDGELDRLETGTFYWGVAGVPGTSLALTVLPGFLGGNDVIAYDLATGDIVWRSSADPVEREPVHVGAVSVVDERLAFGYLPSLDALATFDPRTGEPYDIISDLSSGIAAPISVAIDSAGTLAAAAVFDADEVRVWEVGTTGPGRVIDVSAVDGVYGVALSPDGRLLAAGGDSGAVLVDLSSDGAPVRLDAEGLTAGFGFSPDGSLLAAGDDTFGRLYVFDTQSAAKVADLPLPGAQIAEFSPAGDELVVAAAQSGLVAFDTTTWTRNWSIPRELLTGAVLFADLIGDELIAMETTGVIHRLTLDRGELVRVAKTRVSRSFTAIECEEFDIDPCPTLEELRGG